MSERLEDIAQIACRLLAIYLALWALSELLSLPSDILGLLHHWNNLHTLKAIHEGTGAEHYWLAYYGYLAASRSLMLFFYSGTAYYCAKLGKRIMNFLVKGFEPPA